MRVTNGIPLGSSLLLPVCTVNCVQTLKACAALAGHLPPPKRLNRSGLSITGSNGCKNSLNNLSSIAPRTLCSVVGPVDARCSGLTLDSAVLGLANQSVVRPVDASCSRV
jgi:hypothetical protein